MDDLRDWGTANTLPLSFPGLELILTEISRAEAQRRTGVEDMNKRMGGVI